MDQPKPPPLIESGPQTGQKDPWAQDWCLWIGFVPPALIAASMAAFPGPDQARVLFLQVLTGLCAFAAGGLLIRYMIRGGSWRAAAILGLILNAYIAGQTARGLILAPLVYFMD